MKLQVFEGGVATRLAPQLLKNNQGIVYENIDNATGVLTPLKDKLKTDIVATQFNTYFNAEDEWLSADTITDFLEFQSKMYLTDRVTRPQKYSGGAYSLLGIERPKVKSTITSISVAKPLSSITALNKDTFGDLSAADFDYRLFNVNDGIYSTPFEFTVYASRTAEIRAAGEISYVANPPDSIESLTGSVTTIITPSFRAIEFSELKGDLADSARLYRYYDGAWRLLYEFTAKTDVFSDSTLDITANEELDTDNISAFNNTTSQYVYTYYNSTEGIESAPNPVSDEITATSGSLQITLSEVSSDPQVTHKRLYRVGGNLTQFTLVEQIDAATTVYIDKLRDTEVDGRLLESDNFYEAPIGLKFLSESYAMLFGAVGSSLRFTPIGNPNAWPPEFELQFEADITGLGAVANGVLVFTKTKTFIVTGTGPTTLTQQPLRGDQGCIAFESISEAAEGTLIWASTDGLCTSSGNNVVSLTKGFLGKITLTPISSVVNDETYYCHNEDGSILAWDYRFNNIPKYLNLGTNSLSVANGELYGHNEGFLYLLYKDTGNLTFKYKSPRFVEGAFSENKTYKKVYIRSEGDIIINIIIDDEVVANFNLTSKDTHQLQVPQQLQRGYSIQFEIEGTGTVHEIDYLATMRQNG